MLKWGGRGERKSRRRGMGALEEQMRMRGRGERWSGRRRKIEEKGERSGSSVYFPKFPPAKDIQVWFLI